MPFTEQLPEQLALTAIDPDAHANWDSLHATLTQTGEAMVIKAPAPLQDLFSQQFAELEEWEQSMIVAALQRVASMMNAGDIDASPMLHVGVADGHVSATD